MIRGNIVNIINKQDRERGIVIESAISKHFDKTTQTSTGVIETLVDAERTENLKRLVNETCQLEGDMAEFGVYKGGSAKAIAQTCPKRLHLFDTFSGLPQDDIYTKGHKKGEFAASYKEVVRSLKGLNTVFHVGVFPDTTIWVPHDTRFSFVHIDCDIQQSVKDAITYFLPRMVHNGVMVFDDYDWYRCPGVKRIVDAVFSNIHVTRQQCWIKL